MSGQLGLFDAPVTAGRHRRSDPRTSVVAGRELPLRARQQEVVDALRLLSRSATADEVRQTLRDYGFERERNEVASRLSELERRGLARKVGVRPNHKGRNVATWRLA